MKLRLVVDLTYEQNGVSEMELRGYLEQIIESANQDCLMTQDSPAWLKQYEMEIVSIPHNETEDSEKESGDEVH